MKNLTTGAVALILLSSIQSNASELNWSFKSPAFHYGNGYSTHVLSVEQLQHNRREDARKEAEIDPLKGVTPGKSEDIKDETAGAKSPIGS